MRGGAVKVRIVRRAARAATPDCAVATARGRRRRSPPPSCRRARSARPRPGRSGKIVAVGAESEYADVISQVGGKYVQVTAIVSNPNTDPHSFEASPSGRPRDQRGPARRAERRRLRHVHDHDRGRRAELGAQGHRRAEAARAAGHARPTRTCGTSRATMPTVAKAIAADLAAAPARARRLLQGQRERAFDRLAAALVPRHRRRSRRPTRAPRWRPPSRWRTTCCRPRARTT